VGTQAAGRSRPVPLSANPTDHDDYASETRRNVSLTDPAASWPAAPDGPAFYAYSTNDLIDLEAGIIVDVEATPAHRGPEGESTRTMIERVEQRFGLKVDRLVGDTAYGTAPMLGWMVKDQGIAPNARTRGRRLAAPWRAPRARVRGTCHATRVGVVVRPPPALNNACSEPTMMKHPDTRTRRCMPSTSGPGPSRDRVHADSG
jgi:hypothetical protein